MSKIACVDAFTASAFRGNPAGVCWLDGPADTSWMQCLAAEMNLPETAFIHRTPSGLEIRWFTPLVEVDLCGHATLAAAHFMWEEGLQPSAETIRFASRSGTLSARLADGLIELNFPAEPAEAVPTGHAVMADALGQAPLWVGRNRFDYLVELDSEDTVRRLTPSLQDVAALGPRGVIVTAPATTPQVDFVSRFFAPSVGIPEDPVTGSAHCCLAPFWAPRLGRTTMEAAQVSSRSGRLRVTVKGNRVLLAGKAVTIHSGRLCI